MNKTLENLKRLIGSEFDRDKIIIAFDTEETVIVNESNNNGYDYIAYVENSEEQYLFTIEDDVITDVWLA